MQTQRNHEIKRVPALKIFRRIQVMLANCGPNLTLRADIQDLYRELFESVYGAYSYEINWTNGEGFIHSEDSE